MWLVVDSFLISFLELIVLNSCRADVYPEVAPFVISVAATNGADELTYFSNYGKDSIDIAAPGAL